MIRQECLARLIDWHMKVMQASACGELFGTRVIFL